MAGGPLLLCRFARFSAWPRLGGLIGSASAPFRRPVLCAICSAFPGFGPDQFGGPSSWGVSSGSRPAFSLGSSAGRGLQVVGVFAGSGAAVLSLAFWGGVDGGRRFERRTLKNIKYVFTNSVSIPAGGAFLKSANTRYLECFWSEFLNVSGLGVRPICWQVFAEIIPYARDTRNFPKKSAKKSNVDPEKLRS